MVELAEQDLDESDIIESTLSEELLLSLGIEESESKYDNSKPKPPTEILLDELQEKYLQNRTDETWKEMFIVCLPYAKSLILKKIKSKVFLEQDYVNECAVSVVLRFLNQYKTNPEFKVDWSFAGMMVYKVLEVLYGHKKEDNHVSLNFYMNDDSKGELGDYLTKIGYRNILNPNEAKYYNPEYVIQEGMDSFNCVKDVLSELDASLPDNKRLCLLIRFRALMMFRYPRSRHADSVFKKQFARDYKEECIIDQTLLEIRNRIKAIS